MFIAQRAAPSGINFKGAKVQLNLRCACLILNSPAGVRIPVAVADDAAVDGVLRDARTNFSASVSSGFCDSGRLTSHLTAVAMFAYLLLSAPAISAEGRLEVLDRVPFLVRAACFSCSSSAKHKVTQSSPQSLGSNKRALVSLIACFATMLAYHKSVRRIPASVCCASGCCSRFAFRRP